jgi:hypothetical protein
MAAHFWCGGLLASLLALAGLTAGLLANEAEFAHIDDAAAPDVVQFETASYPAYGPYDVTGNYSQSYGNAEPGDDCCPQWSFLFTQTADYGTSLALPITLTPANTLIGPLGGVEQILDLQLLGDLGLLDNLGLIPGPVADSTRRRRRILNLVQEALSQLRLDMKYLVFDLEATRRERDTLRHNGEGEA